MEESTLQQVRRALSENPGFASQLLLLLATHLDPTSIRSHSSSESSGNDGGPRVTLSTEDKKMSRNVNPEDEIHDIKPDLTDDIVDYNSVTRIDETVSSPQLSDQKKAEIPLLSPFEQLPAELRQKIYGYLGLRQKVHSLMVADLDRCIPQGFEEPFPTSINIIKCRHQFNTGQGRVIVRSYREDGVAMVLRT